MLSCCGTQPSPSLLHHDAVIVVIMVVMVVMVVVIIFGVVVVVAVVIVVVVIIVIIVVVLVIAIVAHGMQGIFHQCSQDSKPQVKCFQWNQKACKEQHCGLPHISVDIPLCKSSQCRYVLDPNDRPTATTLCANKAAKNTHKVSQTSTDIKHACTGAQIWKEEFGGMCMLVSNTLQKLR
jgi:hypothetical protein